MQLPDQARGGAIRAAQYLRMSTEHQRYSIGNQGAAISAYAADRGYEIVRTYVDRGVSGLLLTHRQALQSLLADVVAGRADYQAILVYDVSRWGRFQDPDQSAHYEFICREAGVGVVYCAEPFENDGSLGATLIKHLKRAMAAEYSRELSQKVLSAQRRAASLGFRQGGPAGYGLRRQMVDELGRLRQVLSSGEQKAVQGFRVILTPGPAEEVATVVRIYKLFVITGMTRSGIAATLSREGVPGEAGAQWTRSRVHGILTNEKYVGRNVYQRTTRYLKGPSTKTPADQQVRVDGAFAPIVDPALFDQARRLIRNRSVRLTDREMLERLSAVLAKSGYLSAEVINDAEGVPCVEMYRRRFGGLKAAYRRIGYERGHTLRERCAKMRESEMLAALRALLVQSGRLTHRLIDASPQMPCAETYRNRFGSLRRAYARIGYDVTGTGTARVRTDRRFTEVGMLEDLRELLAIKGRPSSKLISDAHGLPSASTYLRKFGSFLRIYELLGYDPPPLVGAAARSRYNLTNGSKWTVT